MPVPVWGVLGLLLLARWRFPASEFSLGSFYLLLLVWLCVASVSGIVGLVVTAKRRYEALRSPDGRCRGCGYDIRASRGRCPECGREIKAEEELGLMPERTEGSRHTGEGV